MNDKNQRQSFQNIREKILLICIIVLLLLLIKFILLLIPLTFDFVYGENVIDGTLTTLVGNTKDPDKIALSIMAWEQKYFDNPYSNYKVNSTLQKLGIYNINGEYRWFIRPAPVSWIIHSKLANCEEYARVFVILLNEAGIEARLVHAPGEDHVWAEYMHNGHRIAVDPSQNHVIGSHKKEFEKVMGVNFSYIESVDLQNTKKDISEEYIEKGNLTVIVFDKDKPIHNAKVSIKNPYLMEKRSDKYSKPLTILSKTTGNYGKVSFKLGQHKYVAEVKVDHILFDSVYQKNIMLGKNQEIVIYFDLEHDKGTMQLVTIK